MTGGAAALKTYRLPEHQANVLTAFFAIVFLLVGPGLLYFSSTWPRPDPRLSSGGEVTQGVVLSAPELYVDNRKEVTYRFTTSDGRVVEGRDRVLATTIRERRELREGLTVPVRYLPEDPAVNRVDTGRSTTNGLTPLLGGTFSLVGVWLLARSLRREWRRRRAGAADPTGTSAESAVVFCQP